MTKLLTGKSELAVCRLLFNPPQEEGAKKSMVVQCQFPASCASELAAAESRALFFQNVSAPQAPPMPMAPVGQFSPGLGSFAPLHDATTVVELGTIVVARTSAEEGAEEEEQSNQCCYATDPNLFNERCNLRCVCSEIQ